MAQLEPQTVVHNGGQRRLLAFAGLNGLCGLVAGAIGAHAVSDPAAAALVAQASTYQLIHAVLLASLALQPRRLRLASYLLAAGMILFCGSLYGKGFWSWPTTMAPAGGILLMLGWLSLAVGAVKRIQP